MNQNQKQPPSFGLPVLDLQRSIHFYQDQIGLTVDRNTDALDTATLITPQNMQFVLAGPDAPAWGHLLAENPTVLKRGEKIFVNDLDFEERLARLTREGAVEFALIERPWGDRGIEAICPDGYGVSLWDIPQRSRSDILRLARIASRGFRSITSDVNATDLARKPAADEWSIQEIIHHVADANLTTFHAIRYALATPGAVYRANPYDQDHYARELRYQDRNPAISIQLLESLHDTLISLLETVPNAWDRSTAGADGRQTSVETYLLMQTTHALEHLEQINSVRAELGYPARTFPFN